MRVEKRGEKPNIDGILFGPQNLLDFSSLKSSINSSSSSETMFRLVVQKFGPLCVIGLKLQVALDFEC